MLLISCSVKFLCAQSYYLVPSNFFPEKGQKAEISVFYGKGFDTLKAKKTQVSQLSTALLYAGGKPLNLLPDNKNTQTSLSVELQNSGICLIAAGRETKTDDIEREDLIRQFSNEGFAPLSEKMEDKDEFNIDNIFTAKTLLMATKPGGNHYSEKTDQELEVILLQNPYKMHYGEDIAAQVLFKGKPAAKVRTEVYTKTLNGSVFTSDYVTDEDGKIYIKLNRAGEWMIRAVQIQPSGQKNPDYIRWCSSYSFGFK